jgi:hypothetical protein
MGWPGLNTHGSGEIAYRIMAVRSKGKIMLTGIRRKQEFGIKIYTHIYKNTIVRLLNGITCSKINSSDGFMSTS